MRMRIIRQKKGISQKELAKRVGITQAYVSEIETGMRRPGYELFLRLADALDCSLDDLAGRKSNGDSIAKAG